MSVITPRATLLALALIVSAPGYTDDLTPEKKLDIGELLEMTGALELGEHMGAALLEAMVQRLRQDRPDIPGRVLDIIVEETNEVTRENIGRLNEAVIPLYHKYFTGDEIKGMIQFYSTELGQKAIRVTPLLVGESMQLGQEWGNALGPTIQKRIEERLANEGYELRRDGES